MAFAGWPAKIQRTSRLRTPSVSQLADDASVIGLAGKQDGVAADSRTAGYASFVTPTEHTFRPGISGGRPGSRWTGTSRVRGQPVLLSCNATGQSHPP